MPELYTGRLVTDGDGHLFGGEEVEGSPRVRYDEDEGGYIEISEEDESHNEVHGKNIVETGRGTTGPLYDEQANLVDPGDPHHVHPVPTDPHFDEFAENKTRLQWDRNDEDSSYDGDPTVTGHTEAYSG